LTKFAQAQSHSSIQCRNRPGLYSSSRSSRELSFEWGDISLRREGLD